MSSPIYLALDVVNKRLVSFNGSVTDLPPLYQRDNQPYQIQFVQPFGTINSDGAAYQVLDKNAASVRFTIGPTPTGTAGSPTPYIATYESGWTWDSVNQWFMGYVNHNTTALQTAMGALALLALFMEIKIVEDGIATTIFSHRGSTNITIFANEDEGSSTAPTPTDQYFTQAESDQRYIRKLEPSANFRCKSGQLQFWDASAFALDNTKPWRALGVDNGATVWSDPIAD